MTTTNNNTALVKAHDRPLPVQVQTQNLDVYMLGETLARSGFFSDTRDAGQAVVKMLAGAELGFGPVASMTGVYIVKGKVSLSSNLMAAAIKRSGKYNYRVTEHTDSVCTIEFYEAGERIGISTFTIQDAQQGGLGGDNWRKFPRNMLFSRALSNGAKWYCPDVFGGPIYTPDEMGERVDPETGEVLGYTPPQVEEAHVVQETPRQSTVTKEVDPRAKHRVERLVQGLRSKFDQQDAVFSLAYQVCYDEVSGWDEVNREYGQIELRKVSDEYDDAAKTATEHATNGAAITAPDKAPARRSKPPALKVVHEDTIPAAQVQQDSAAFFNTPDGLPFD